MKKIYHELEPYYNNDSEILILGSIPSVKSREQGFYYAHSQNKFWKIISEIYDEIEPKTIENKKEFLKKYKIALWDVIKSCDIQGSSDSSIKNIEVNNINLILKNSNIKKIFTTGKKATALYKKYCYKNTRKESIYLPSTSPANCGYCTYEELLNIYKENIIEKV